MCELLSGAGAPLVDAFYTMDNPGLVAAAGFNAHRPMKRVGIWIEKEPFGAGDVKC